MNAIIHDVDSVTSLSCVEEFTKHTGTILALPFAVEKDTKLKEELLGFLKELSQEEWVILLIDPRISYKTVAEFELPEVHILRLALPKDALCSFPLFLSDKEGDQVVGADFPFASSPRLRRDFLLELSIARYGRDDFPFELPSYSVLFDGENRALVDTTYLKGASLEEVKLLLKETLNLNDVLFFSPLYESKGEIKRYLSFVDKKKLVVNPAYLKKEVLPQLKDCGYTPLLMPRQVGADSYTSFYTNDTTLYFPLYQKLEDEEALKEITEFVGDSKKVLPVPVSSTRYIGHTFASYFTYIPYSPKIEIEPREEVSTHQFYKEEKKRG